MSLFTSSAAAQCSDQCVKALRNCKLPQTVVIIALCQHSHVTFHLRAQLLTPCLWELRSSPSRWRPQTTCSAWPTWPESWCACASAAWATVTSTRPSSWASSCGRSTTVSHTSGTRALTKSLRSCIRCDRAWAKWRTPATPCMSVARRSPNTCWPTCSPLGPHSSTQRKEWFNPAQLQWLCLCSLSPVLLQFYVCVNFKWDSTALIYLVTCL